MPEDVAVIGADDIVESRYFVPSLSTIAVDREHIAALAVRLLIDRISSKRTGEPEYFEVPFKLVPRTSTIGNRYDPGSEWTDVENQWRTDDQ